MASQRARISALFDQLDRLGDKRTGMPIDADEWNSLVGAMRDTLSVVSAQEQSTTATLEARYAAADHSHLAEVSTEWLDADLRGAIGAGAGPQTVTGLVAGAQLGGQLGRLQDDLGRVRQVLEDQQARIDGTIVADLERTNAVTDLRDQVAAVEDLRTVVSGVENQLRGTARHLERLDGLRAALTDGSGNVVDVGALQGRVAELGRLRDNLTDEQGNLVRMSDVLVRLGEISATGGSGDAGLEDRIGALGTRLQERFDRRLTNAVTDLTTTTTEQVDQARADLDSRIGAAVTSARTELQQLTDGRVGAAEQRLDAGLAASLQVTATGLRAELTGLADAAVQQGLAGVDARITTAVEQVGGQLGASLRADLTQVATSAADERVGTLTGSLSQQVVDLGARLDSVGAVVDGAVGTAVDARLADVTSALDAGTVTRIDQARQAIVDSIGAEVDQAVTRRVGDLDATVGSLVDTRLAAVDSRIDNRVAVAMASLPDVVRTEVTGQIGATDLAGQLSTLETRVTEGFRAGLAETETRLEANRSAAINEAVLQARNESLAVTSGLEQRLTAELSTTRLNLEETIGRINLVGPIRPPIR